MNLFGNSCEILFFEKSYHDGEKLFNTLLSLLMCSACVVLCFRRLWGCCGACDNDTRYLRDVRIMMRIRSVTMDMIAGWLQIGLLCKLLGYT